MSRKLWSERSAVVFVKNKNMPPSLQDAKNFKPISDANCNFIYLSTLLTYDYPRFTKHLTEVLERLGIGHDFIAGTRDIWARDYMPIQVSRKKFVRFRFNPDYLKNDKDKKTRTDNALVCRKLGIKTIDSKLVVDGGNVLRHGDKVLITTKVFRENRNRVETGVIHELEDLLEVHRVIFIPEDAEDVVGHVDGYARWLDKETVLINERTQWNELNRANIIGALGNAGLKWVEVPYFDARSRKDGARGLYINYLQLVGAIVLPSFNHPKDKEALERFTELFGEHEVVQIPCNDIARKSGILNCVSWSILRQTKFLPS